MRHSQLSLSLPPNPPTYNRGAFIISPSNEAALKTAKSWLRSTDPSLIICGPPSSGKTHLSHIIADTGAGAILNINEIDEAASAAPEIIIIDNLSGEGVAPRDLLAALADMVSRHHRLVLVGAGSPSEWSGGLKDLRTRLESMPRAVLFQPDEELMRKVIAKLFRDRQIGVKPGIINYAAPRLRRTFAAASAFVALCDEAALTASRPVSLAVAQKIVANLSEGGPTA